MSNEESERSTAEVTTVLYVNAQRNALLQAWIMAPEEASLWLSS
jgi:hypothetical protein